MTITANKILYSRVFPELIHLNTQQNNLIRLITEKNICHKFNGLKLNESHLSNFYFHQNPNEKISIFTGITAKRASFVDTYLLNKNFVSESYLILMKLPFGRQIIETLTERIDKENISYLTKTISSWFDSRKNNITSIKFKHNDYLSGEPNEEIVNSMKYFNKANEVLGEHLGLYNLYGLSIVRTPELYAIQTFTKKNANSNIRFTSRWDIERNSKFAQSRYCSTLFQRNNGYLNVAMENAYNSPHVPKEEIESVNYISLNPLLSRSLSVSPEDINQLTQDTKDIDEINRSLSKQSSVISTFNEHL
ncbi:MAG: hypothetical protein QNJ31_07130 [Candidatus Caenarcaniphilales bacterium]|nr:hypothetical protein [Candidatus Caenarcaniphilales bacterium]